MLGIVTSVGPNAMNTATEPGCAQNWPKTDRNPGQNSFLEACTVDPATLQQFVFVICKKSWYDLSRY